MLTETIAAETVPVSCKHLTFKETLLAFERFDHERHVVDYLPHHTLCFIRLLNLFLLELNCVVFFISNILPFFLFNPVYANHHDE